MSENVTEKVVMNEGSAKDMISNLLDGTGLTADYNTEDGIFRVTVEDGAEDIIDKIKNIYEGVKMYNAENEKKVTVMVDLKSCGVEKKAEVLKFALHHDDLEDPLMLLNILNLVKVYNTLDDAYFQASDIFVNSVEELLDLKLALSTDIKDFSRRLSIYFLSIIKSYNKMTFTPADEHIALPKAFESLILASDLLSLSGIFAKASNISTSDLTYIDNAYIYMTSLINKGIDCANMLGEFLEEHEVQ